MSFVPGDENIDKIPVALGIKEKNLYLSCVVKDKKPTLQLEVSEHQQPKALLNSSEAHLAITDFQDSHLLPHTPHPRPPKTWGQTYLTILRNCKYAIAKCMQLPLQKIKSFH